MGMRVVWIMPVPGAWGFDTLDKSAPQSPPGLDLPGFGVKGASLFAVAGQLKAQYRISLADSIALAQAIKAQGALLTCNHHEFDILDGKEPVQFCWIR